MMKATGINLDEEQIKRLEQIASDKGVNRSIVIRWAIDEYIKLFFTPSCPIDVTVGAMNEQQPALQPA